MANPLSLSLALALGALAVGLAALLVVGAYAPAGTRAARAKGGVAAYAYAAVVLGGTGWLASAGLLADLDARPPPLGMLLVMLTATTAAVALSPLGDRLLALPLSVLVGFQAFRVLVEAWLSAAHFWGSVPAAVTWHGHNVDVVTGVLAAGLGVWLWRGGPSLRVVRAWNVLGLVLLGVVVATAAVSAFGVVETAPRMTLPATFPAVWLPAWIVQVALLGHLVVARKLRLAGRQG